MRKQMQISIELLDKKIIMFSGLQKKEVLDLIIQAH